MAKTKPTILPFSVSQTVNQVSDWVFRINRYAFAPLVAFAIGTFAIEAATYPGFVQKVTDVKPLLFLNLAMVSYSILVFRKFFFDEEFTPESLLVLRANALLLPLGVFLMTSLWKLEAAHFPNYVFSTFHLNLNILQQVLNFNFFLAIPYLLTHYLNIKPIIWPKELSRKNVNLLPAFFFAISIVLLSALQLNKAFLRAGKDLTAIMRTPFASIEERRRQVIGPFYEIFTFLNAYIDETATVAVPPQRESGTVGNVGYARYFMYPRYLIHEEDFVPEALPEIDYFVITRSSFDEATQRVTTWPTHPVKAEVIYLYNEDTKEVQVLENQMYSPDNPIFYDKWGVIKVAKASQ
jgi:hypothetical protein